LVITLTGLPTHISQTNELYPAIMGWYRRENLDTKTGENKLDSRHYEKTTFARIQSQSGP